MEISGPRSHRVATPFLHGLAVLDP